MLLTPQGQPADSIDRIMLLSTWAEHLEHTHFQKNERKPIITAGMGKPTFPLHQSVIESSINYWSNIGKKSQEAKNYLDILGVTSEVARSHAAKILGTIDYGNAQGDLEFREKIAKFLTTWYGNIFTVQPNHILFTVGGAGSLHNIFTVLGKICPNGYIVTAFPHYSLYSNSYSTTKLYPIDMMQQQGYRLTAELLEKTLYDAHKTAASHGTQVSAFLLCDPNNPLGTALSKNELKKIADVLCMDENKNIFIILDEAYTEMRFDGNKKLSLLTVAPQLANRIIIIRSATKALSCAGERMAITFTSNIALMNKLIQENVAICGHAPRSAQMIFANALEKMDDLALDHIADYYKPQVDYVVMRLKAMNALLPDPHYKINGTFYVIADLSDLFYLTLPIETKSALNKTGKIENDEDIAYFLLFSDSIMIAPLSYFGLSNKLGYLRITCSGGEHELTELMDRIEKRLIEARNMKRRIIHQSLQCLETISAKNF